MKKAMRKLLCVALVMLLVATMTIPAMANNASGHGDAGSFYYEWELSCTTETATASIETPNIATSVTAAVKSYVYYDLTREYRYTDEEKLVNYRSVTVSSDNIITINDVPVRGEVKGAVGSFWVGSTLVLKEAYTGIER